jgi:hypothetical protein
MAGGIEISGVPGFEASIDALIAAAQAAALRGVTAGAHLIEAQAKQSMNGPGPQVQTGTLRRSINVIDTTTLGGGSYQARIAPTVIYGRRQELGFHGVDSIGRHYNQRGRPYLSTGLNRSLPLLQGVFSAAWQAAMRA